MFTCSGIPIERNQSNIRVLTSANLAEAMRGKEELGSTMKVGKSFAILLVHSRNLW